VALPPERAIRAFTALGEREWAPGWDPVFPAGEADEAGTVFTTAAGGVPAIWVIFERTPLTARYARVAPGVSAGTVEVALRPDGAHTVAEVAYALTALGPDAGLDAFAAGYDEMLATWERLIGEAADRF
jgi:hypothetical protein